MVDGFVGTSQLLYIQPGEIVILLSIFVIWALAIAVFLHKWRSIRIVRSPETRFDCYCPKNLETVKVVARHRDSVIYKNYTENMTRTLQARQKRLDRMNTMPNIKLGEEITRINQPRMSLPGLSGLCGKVTGFPELLTGKGETGGEGLLMSGAPWSDLAKKCGNIMAGSCIQGGGGSGGGGGNTISTLVEVIEEDAELAAIAESTAATDDAPDEVFDANGWLTSMEQLLG